MEILLLNKFGGKLPRGAIICSKDDGAPWGAKECLGSFLVARVDISDAGALLPHQINNGPPESRADGTLWTAGGLKVFKFVDLGSAKFTDDSGADFDIGQLAFIPWFVPRLVDPVVMDFTVNVEPEMIIADQ